MFTPSCWCVWCGGALTVLSSGKRERVGCRKCVNRRRRHRYQRDPVFRLVQRLRGKLCRSGQQQDGPIEARSVVDLLRDRGYDVVRDRDLIDDLRIEPLDATLPFTLDNATLAPAKKYVYH